MKKTDKNKVKEFIRVDHAGERGAIKIYEGQLLALNTFINDDDLKKCSLYGTDKIVRVPFNNKLSAECLPLILEVVSAKMFIAEQYGLAEECVKYWEETTGNCCCRGVIIWKMLREKGYNAKLKIGSLGFIQSNNKDISILSILYFSASIKFKSLSN